MKPSVQNGVVPTYLIPTQIGTNAHASVCKIKFGNFETFRIPKKPYMTNMNISRGSGHCKRPFESFQTT